MRTSGFAKLFVVALGLATCPVVASAQGEPPPVYPACPNGLSVACGCRPCPAPSRPVYAPAPPNNAAAEHESEVRAERAREEERARAASAAAAEAKRKHEEFEKEKRDALSSLKGDSSDDLGLKGVGADTIKDKNTPFFGLKGVGDTGIKDLAPARNQRDVSTAWKQFHCAAEISGYAIADANKPDGQIDLDEVRYLAGEAISALHGESLGVQCSQAPPMPRLRSQAELDSNRLLPFYESLMRRTVSEAERLNAINQEIQQLQQKNQAAEQKVATLKESSAGAAAAPQGNSEADQIARAEVEQKAYHERERQQALEVYAKQKQQESAMAQAMAALRAAQRLINLENEKKAAAMRQLQRFEDMNNRLQSSPALTGVLARQIQ